MSTIVTGASDDLIELEGDIDEEVDALEYADKGAYLAFDNGAIVLVIFSREGFWRISTIYDPANAVTITVCENTDPDDGDYSDRATIERATRFGVGATRKAAFAALVTGVQGD